MYITKIHLEDIRCFEEASIDLGRNGNSLLIAGNNGNGKSAILRSLAMGLCDKASAGSLLRELLGDFIRKEEGKDKRTATITIDLFDKSTQKDFQIKTEIITNKELGFEVVEQKLNEGNIEKQEDFPWSKIFVAGYGAGLRTEGTQDYGQYFAADAVYSLFKYSHEMQNPELIWRRLLEVARDSIKEDSGNTIKDVEESVNEEVKKCLLGILDLSSESSQSGDISLENNGIYITSDWGKQELSALGDGYRGLTTMVMDILSWQLLMKNNKTILKELEENEPGDWVPLGLVKDCTGIVIIDEIEKHLHPKLQRFAIKKLKDVFPQIQFIISSHSPLCVAGTADAEDSYVVYRSLSDDKNNQVKKWVGGLSGLRTDQILEHFFQVPYVNESTLDDIEKYSRLFLRKESENDLDQSEENELEALKEKLNKTAQALLLERETKLLNEAMDNEFKIIKNIIDEK